MTALPALAVALPFAAACLGLALGGARPRLVAPVAVGGAALTALAVAVVATRVLSGPDLLVLHTGQAPTGTASFGITLTADPLAAVVGLAVVAVALLVQVYSVAYLRGDPRYSSYAALVSLFTAAMLLVVLAGDLLVLFVGWEVMGICSYFLIGHYWETPDARAAAVKSFLVTRVGDVALLFGIFALGLHAGSFRIADVLLAGPAGTVALLLVLAGAVGKSAQFPLHVWLPDAMAGPTPISALIHAATMVAAGVYLLLRLWPLYLVDAAALAVVAVVAAVTMVGSALVALVQVDLKRVLAWSTVSQLAYMFGGVAVAAPTAALFHLLSHAAFKALLFLAAGAVMHELGTALMQDMGGLRRAMPVTAATTAVGLGALAGVPPLAGFWSKDAVLAAAEDRAVHGGPVPHWVGWLVLVAGLLTVGLTAAYATRVWLRAFAGPRRGASPVHEAPGLMRWPLVLLAVPTVLLGLLALPGWLTRAVGFDAPVPPGTALTFVWGQAPSTPEAQVRVPGAAGAALAPSAATAAVGLLLLLAGAGAVWAVWRRDPSADPALALGRVRPVLARAFGVDAVYDRLIVRPVDALARLVVTGDRDVVDAYVRGAGRGAVLLGGLLRGGRSGSVQRYLTVLLAGAVVVAVAGVLVGTA
ncbi:MAG TPA: NADH-quinone oxidoreductase subunit L [Motilibacteraceae bacterium]|nr:NADH-quinone oxidoreductase subunit L [Motilibacteraceae bacterium]